MLLRRYNNSIEKTTMLKLLSFGVLMLFYVTCAGGSSVEQNEAKIRVLEGRFETFTGMLQDMQREMTEIRRSLIMCSENDKESTIRTNDGKNTVQMNDTDLEQRVTFLEIQMLNVNEELVTITEDLIDVENGVENVEGQITVILADQVTQDERLLELEQDMEETVQTLERHDDALKSLEDADMAINASAAALEQTVSDIEELNTTIQIILFSLDELEGAVEDHGSSIEALNASIGRMELNGTIAFHAYLGDYDSVPESTVIVFGNVNVNIGNGYDGSTGQFTVPPGGDGLYYLYGHFAGHPSMWYRLALRKNGSTLCIAWEDENTGGDNPASSCGAVTVLYEGEGYIQIKRVRIQLIVKRIATLNCGLFCHLRKE